MKSWLESLLIALSMYSALPVKCMNWTNRNLRHALVFFPLIGVICMAALALLWVICSYIKIGSVLFGVLAVCIMACNRRNTSGRFLRYS